MSPVVSTVKAENLRHDLGLMPANGLIGVPACLATGYGSGLDPDLIRIGALAETERYHGQIDTITWYVSSGSELDNDSLLTSFDALVNERIATHWAARIRTPTQARLAIGNSRVRRIEIPFGSITDEILQIVGPSSAYVNFAVPASIGSAALVALAHSTGIDEIVIEVASKRDIVTAQKTLATIDRARGFNRFRAA
ncbi:MAG: hypothetical protein Q4P05_05730 [Actinomycetaceae bacterium]|nr:hypothetical protein [Actinomycetaceae bacterium]